MGVCLPESRQNKQIGGTYKMSMYKYIRNAWKKPSRELLKDRLIKWRQEPVTFRIDKPTRLDRARSLGYKAKEGVIIVRQRVMRSARVRPKFKGGRRSRTMRRKKIVNKSYQIICEERVARKYPNCEVLNSYYVNKDGSHMWYEVILVDRDHPAIKKDKELAWITTKKGRVHKGMTSAAKRSKMKNQ